MSGQPLDNRAVNSANRSAISLNTSTLTSAESSPIMLQLSKRRKPVHERMEKTQLFGLRTKTSPTHLSIVPSFESA